MLSLFLSFGVWMNVSNDIATLFVKCPILSKCASFSEANFLQKRAVVFLIKTTKRFIREKTCRSRCAHTHSSLSLSVCFCFCILYWYLAIRCARRIADWTVASFLRRMDLDFFNFAREIRVSSLCEKIARICALKVGNRDGRCTREDLNARRSASLRAANVRSFDTYAFDADGWMCERAFVRLRALRATLRPDGVFPLSL